MDAPQTKEDLKRKKREKMRISFGINKNVDVGANCPYNTQVFVEMKRLYGYRKKGGQCVSVCVWGGAVQEAVLQGLGPEGRGRCAENDQTAQKVTDSALL